MAAGEAGDVTKLLNAVRAPDGGGDSAEFERIYGQLRAIASELLSRESERGVLQTTALVHEALLRLGQFDADRGEWQSRAHFFGSAARAMRRVLVDEARRRRVHRKAIVFVEQFVFATVDSTRPVGIDLLDLDEAMTALHQSDAVLGEIVALKVFGELPAEMIGSIVGLGEAQVRRKTALAQAWLIRWLRDHGRLPGATP